MQGKRTAEVVIIGAGVVGASIAWHLTSAGCRDVLLLDRESAPAGGSSGRATGGARAQFATQPEIAMSIYSIDLLSRLEELTGVSAGYRPDGFLFVASSDQQMAALEEASERQRAAGLSDVELLRTEAVAAMVPALRVDDVRGASFRQRDGMIDPRAIRRGFLAAAERQGARVQFSSIVQAIEVDRRRAVGVQTWRERISAAHVVNAAGAWAASLLTPLGLSLPVTPLRRQIAGIRCAAPMPQRLPMVIDMATGFHFRRDLAAGEDAYLLAWPEPDTPVEFDTRYEESFGIRVLEHAKWRCPPLGAGSIERSRCRAGLYEMTPDHRAIIDRAPGVERIWLANGFSGHGVMHAPATGRIVSDLILHGKTDAFDIAPLRATRFAEGDAVPELSLL
jgi:sarcosine oxidase subunit beta